MKAYFIGGHWDKRILDLPEDKVSIRVPVLDCPKVFSSTVFPDITRECCDAQIYERFSFACGDEREGRVFHVYSLRRNSADVFDDLLSGYLSTPNKSISCRS